MKDKIALGHRGVLRSRGAVGKRRMGCRGLLCHPQQAGLLLRSPSSFQSSLGFPSSAAWCDHCGEASDAEMVVLEMVMLEMVVLYMLSPGREESICCTLLSVAAGKDGRCGGALSKAEGEGNPQSPQTREVAGHSHLQLSQRLQLPMGWVLAPSLHPWSIALGLPVPLGSWFGWQLLFSSVCVSSPVPPGPCCQKEKGKERFSVVATCGGAHACSVPLGLGWVKLWPLQRKVASTADLCQGPRAASATAARAWSRLGEAREGRAGCV